MAARLGVVRAGTQRGALLAARSRDALDRPLARPAELTVAIATDDVVLAGAFQREPATAYRRGSGGPEVRLAPGSVHVLLSLATPSALVPCDAKRVVNRSVRPLLRALTKTGHLAHYFGRDWVSVAGRPVAWAGFAHDATSQRTTFEAVVAVGAPFALRDRESLRGREPSIVDVDPARLVDAIAAAYASDVESLAQSLGAAPGDAVIDLPADELLATPAAAPIGPEPAWLATREEAIGTLGAGPDAAGTFRVGGDLLASRDAIARLEAAVKAGGLHAPADIGRLVDATLAAPGVALDGIRALANLRDVIVDALAATAPRQG